jgi:hypothetical protein
MLNMNRGKLLALAGVVLFATLVVATTTESYSTGITRSKGLAAEGCICHGESGHGTPNPNVELYFRVGDNPVAYAPNKVYNLSFGAAASDVPAAQGSNKGGFNLFVNVGKLAPAEGWEEFVSVEPSGQEATHQKKGDQEKGRNWNLTWQAPGEAAEPAIFTLWINTVNGDDTPTADDHFNGGTYVILNAVGAKLGAGGGVDPEHLGVNWLAHWVGIASFAAVTVTLLIYYFVLKYGESIHTTDHRDRKEK